MKGKKWEKKKIWKVAEYRRNFWPRSFACIIIITPGDDEVRTFRYTSRQSLT